MRKFMIIFIALSIFLAQPLFTAENSSPSTKISLNSVGFLPDQMKEATINGTCKDFKLVDDKNATVLKGTVSGPFNLSSNNLSLYIADFTAVTNPGTYYLDVTGIGRSFPVNIRNGIYKEPFKTAMLGFYLWRCGTAVSNNYNGNLYYHNACHLEDANVDLLGLKGISGKRDGTGGWHDAGDYNKYTVNAGVTMGLLFMAWEHFKNKIEKIEIDVPEKKNKSMPAYLSELKWEMTYILKMQYPDKSGRVSHKISTSAFGGFMMPEDETTARYFSPWGSAATAEFAAMAAMAYRIYKPYDKAFAEKCIDAAKLSYDFLVKNPTNHQADISAFSTGAYQTGDYSCRLWADAEMWESLGSEVYLKNFEKKAAEFGVNSIDTDFDWQNVKNLGMITYITSSRKGKSMTIYTQLTNALVSTADDIVSTSLSNAYRRPLGDSYYWGCNGGVARQTLVLQCADAIHPDSKYMKAGLNSLGYLFGRNFYMRSFMTGIGYNPPQHPHDRRSGASGMPWPGYLVGGGWPDELSWEDNQENYRVNEIAINWNAALVYALAWFAD